MLMVCPDEGKQRLLDCAFNVGGTVLGTMEVRGYQNAYTPDDSSTVGSFTQSTFPGYAPVTIIDTDWIAAVIVSHVAEIETNFLVQFNCTGGGGEQMYGWYLVETGTGKVILAQRFDTSRNMTPGAVETLDPFKVKLQSIT